MVLHLPRVLTDSLKWKEIKQETQAESEVVLHLPRVLTDSLKWKVVQQETQADVKNGSLKWKEIQEETQEERNDGSEFAQGIDGLSQVETTDQDATLAQTGADAETAYVSATRAVQGSTTR